MSKQLIQYSDIYKFKLVGDPQVSPDGNWVAFVIETMHKKDKKYYTNLWIMKSNGLHPRQLTFGKRNDHTPRWSPDGKALAFISKRDKGQNRAPGDQVWLLPMQGGEAAPLTSLKRGSLSNIQWSPNGKMIAFLFRSLGKEVKVKDDGEIETPAYRHVKNIWFRLDGTGYFDSENTHLWVAATGSGSARQLVEGPYDDDNFAWSPDSRELAFISFRHADWQLRVEEKNIYTIPVHGGKIQEITLPTGPKDSLSYSPDGNTLAYSGHDRPYQGWGVVNNVLNTIGVNGKKHKKYGEALDRTAVSETIGDITPSFVFEAPIWSTDGENIYYRISTEGGQPMLVANLASSQTEYVTPPGAVTINGSMDFERGFYYYSGASLAAPDEIYRVNLHTGAVNQLTHFNRNYLRNRNFNVAEELEFYNGDQKLQGWLVKPSDFNPRKKYPLILEIHGGPRAQYGRTFFHEMYAIAAAGYVVVYTNPRGSQGYGEDFAAAIAAKWGEPAMADVMAAVDHVIGMGFIDAKRLGVTGGSYGGYMTNWIVTHTDRFKAAVTQRCVSDLSSMFGNSDIGWDLADEFGGPPWENREVYLEWSPITHIANCHTPLLIIHSEFDQRCNVEQGDQMFTALKYLRREVEYVRFPEESHGLSRHGRPDRREARLKFIVDWFDKYLK